LIRWQARLVAESAIASLDELRSLDPEAAKKHLLALADASKDTKAGIGTHVHRYAEAIAKGNVPKAETPEAVPYLRHFDSFIYDVQPEFLGVELPVYNRTHGYAGTADMFAVIDGKAAVVDIKTGKSIWPEVALQLAAYARSEFCVRGGVEEPSPVVQHGYVLHIGESGYELRRCDIGDSTFSAFVAMLDSYRWLAEESSYVIGALVREGANG
jgi:hypothetical protein